MIWWRWGEGAWPGLTSGSRRWTVSCEQPKRRRAVMGAAAKSPKAAATLLSFISKKGISLQLEDYGDGVRKEKGAEEERQF